MQKELFVSVLTVVSKRSTRMNQLKAIEPYQSRLFSKSKRTMYTVFCARRISFFLVNRVEDQNEPKRPPLLWPFGFVLVFNSIHQKKSDPPSAENRVIVEKSDPYLIQLWKQYYRKTLLFFNRKSGKRSLQLFTLLLIKKDSDPFFCRMPERNRPMKQ